MNFSNKTILNTLFCIWLIVSLFMQHSNLVTVVMLIFVGTCLIVCVRRARWSIFLTFYMLFAFFSLANIYLGHSVDYATSMKMTRTLMINSVFFFALINYYYYVGSMSELSKNFVGVSAVISVLAVIANIIYGGERLSGIGINSNTIAMFAAYSMIIVINSMIENSKRKCIDITLVLLFAVTIVLSGSRKGLLIPIIGCYVLVCFRQPRKFVIRSLIAIVLAYCVYQALINIDVLYTLIGNRIEQVVFLLSGQDVVEASLGSRNAYILLAWNSSQDSLFWGHGLDTFRLLRGAYGTYTHSNYLEIIYSLGFGGLTIFYLPYIITLKNAFANIRNMKTAIAPLVAILIPYIICDFMNVTYFERPVLSISIFALVGIQNLHKSSRQEEI